MDANQIAQKLGIPVEEAERKMEIAQRVFADLPTEQQEILKFKARALKGREDTPEGFAHFFWCVYQKELPEHAFYGFIVPTYWAHGLITREQLDKYYEKTRAFRYIYDGIKNMRVPKRGIIIRAAREFAKTIVLTTALDAYRIGQKPHGMHLLVQVSEASAKDNSGKVAEIVAKSPGFAEVFPHVKPDPETGWGAGGYYVKRDDISTDEWVKLCSDRNAPTLLGVGYKSSEVIGKHPNGMALLDDIHDNDNTSSERELRNTLAKIRSDFIYAPTKEAWMVFVGTPWVEGDALDVFAKSGEFVVVDIPAYMEITPSAELTMPESEWFEDGKYIYLWPKERGSDWVRLKKNTSTPAEFARMVQLNVRRALQKNLKYQTFPARDIRWYEWPGVVGVDPVATVTAITGREGGTSHFAAAFALKTPYNNIVIGDGILKKCDADEAERLLADAFKMHRTFTRASIEMDGAGILFAAMQRRAGMTIHPHSTSEIKKTLGLKTSKKTDRQYDFLQSLLANGIVVISDGDSDFLNAARRWADNFPNFDKDSELLDVGDSILLAVFDIPEIWMNLITNLADDKPRSIWKNANKPKSMWASAGDIHV